MSLYYAKLQQLDNAAPVEMSLEKVNMPAGISAMGHDIRAQWSYIGRNILCMYAFDCLESMKMNLLVDTGCTHTLLCMSIFNSLLTAVKERPVPWETSTTLADGSGRPIYG